ncbi:MAG TPA: tetratricopeptide repeat protein [Kofleriaceae bacterium]|nr:tetratricopeptide repeat protein [Kofleriaceae bacterium]
MLVAIAVAVAMCGAAPARADQASDDDDQKARELFRMGETHYSAGRYEKAAVLYDEAYRLSGRAELLLAMVNTYERMGDYAQASEHLRQYLKHPRAKNVSSLRERLRRLERAQRDRDEERERVRRLETTDQSRARELRRLREEDRRRVAQPTATAEAEPRKRSRVPAYVLFGVSGGAVLGAIGFGLAAGSAGQDAELECGDSLCRGSADSALDRELRYSLLADVSGVVAIGSAAVGVYLLWKWRREEPSDERRALRIEPTLLPGGLGVGIAGDL